MTPDAEGPQDATPATRARQRAVLDALPFGDVQDFEDAGRGFVATLPEVSVRNAQGRVVWSLGEYAFLEAAEAPPP
jgi:alkyl sulfatase BDS1-like metallo-beta-lactamase superfamily hydrolase